jgi:signal transduction histidine kinase
MISAIMVGGWVAASAAVVAAGAVWRMLFSRMEHVARACHEVRGPLGSVRLGLQLGARAGELSPERLHAIDLELARAALALDDLDSARTGRVISRGTEPVDLEQLVSDSIEAWRPTAEARGVELRAFWTGRSLTVWGDRVRLAQALGNLISNAIEHGGGVVEVRGRSDGEGARLEVTDNGPGLPAPVGELARRPRGGHGRRGRGLAITSAIASSHGGRLAAAPAERGACLVLKLPAEPRHSRRSSHWSRRSRAAKSRGKPQMVD